MLLGPSGQALEFEIAKVMKLGSGGNFQWSPEGDMVACADGNPDGSSTLTVFDTTGTKIDSWEFAIPCHTLAWVDGDELSVRLRNRPTRNSKHVELLALRIGNPKIDTVVVYTDTLLLNPAEGGYKMSHASYQVMGPYRSVEGSAYYTLREGDSLTFHMVRSTQQRPETMMNNHVLRGGPGGMYLASLAGTDSVQIVDTSYSLALLHPDGNYLWSQGYLVNLVDGTRTDLRDSQELAEVPDGMYLGFGMAHFNPSQPELIFGTSFFDGHHEGERRTYVLDYSTMTFKLLDDLIGVSDCARFQYSACGRWLAFACADGLYLARIEGR